MSISVIQSQQNIYICIHNTYSLYVFRARATNTQLGKEENSAYIRLNVVGEEDAEVAPEIIVAPTDTNTVKGKLETNLHCIVNAR